MIVTYMIHMRLEESHMFHIFDTHQVNFTKRIKSEVFIKRLCLNILLNEVLFYPEGIEIKIFDFGKYFY